MPAYRLPERLHSRHPTKCLGNDPHGRGTLPPINSTRFLKLALRSQMSQHVPIITAVRGDVSETIIVRRVGRHDVVTPATMLKQLSQPRSPQPGCRAYPTHRPGDGLFPTMHLARRCLYRVRTKTSSILTASAIYPHSSGAILRTKNYA